MIKFIARCIVFVSIFTLSAYGNYTLSANEFGIDLMQDVAANNINENIIISPFSIETALTMTFNGSAGETETAMRDVLCLGQTRLENINNSALQLILRISRTDESISLRIANSLWANKHVEFKREFIDRMTEYFRAWVENVNFADPEALSAINDWVSDATEGKITRLVESLEPADILVLINAIYFKGQWQSAFPKDATKEGEFTLPGGESIKISMMQLRDSELNYLEKDEFQAVELPYEGGSASMLIFLPDREYNLPDFIESLTTGKIDECLGAFVKSKGDLHLPRFEARYEAELNDNLIDMGMGIAFGGRADFGLMTDVDCFISLVKHVAVVEINEEGTEAAAATAVKMKRGIPGGTSEKFIMVVDRPFFFIIRNNETGAILFMAAIANPAEER